MTTQEYCAALEQALSPMPPEERQETIRYYLEFLEDANESERAALGTPTELAQRILRENGLSAAAPFPGNPPKRKKRTAIFVALACTFYLWLPLLLTWYILLLTALICIAVIPLSLVCAAGLLLFVGIPLPGTGAWTGTLAASLLDMDFKESVLACMGGVLLAGCIMGVLSTLGISAFGAIAG